MQNRVAGARCLVVGAGGFIGGHLCARLLASGSIVTAFGHPPRHPARSGVAWIVASVTDADSLSAAVEQADYVFHLIGSADPGSSNRDPCDEVLTTVPASLAVLEACRLRRPRRLVFLSSGGTVYRPRLALPIGEEAPTDPVSAYGIGKLMIEKYCALFHQLYGLDSVVLRIANPFGPDQDPDRGQGFVARVMKCALTGEAVQLWGDGGGIVRDFIYIGDVAEAIETAAISQTDLKLFNIGSGVGRSLTSVIDDVADVVGKPVRVDHGPGRSADTPVNVLDITRAREQLGWTPGTEWRAGLSLTRDWMAGFLGDEGKGPPCRAM